MRLSVIVPVFNRPTEVKDFLDSLTLQTDTAFEVVVVEDGSTHLCDAVVAGFKSTLTIHYRYKENSGPGPTRNAGSKAATGDYLIFLDSDCVLPDHYIQTVRQALELDYADAFGGPDQARDDFSPLQRAINYSMTSFFTTGGIRGGSETLRSEEQTSELQS